MHCVNTSIATYTQGESARNASNSPVFRRGKSFDSRFTFYRVYTKRLSVGPYVDSIGGSVIVLELGLGFRFGFQRELWAI